MRNEPMRERDKKELLELAEQIQPQPNEEIARRAVQLALKWINKAERQAVQIKNLEGRNVGQPQALIDQLRWERDVAVKQLHDLGHEFGKEPSAQPEKHTETHECVYQRTETHEWIPVTERLPEEDLCTGYGRQYSESVLITAHNMIDDEDIVDYGHTVDGRWFSDTTDAYIPDNWIVTAWQMLPEPYKGGTE